MIEEKNLKKDYRTTLFLRITKCLSNSGKTTNMILEELKKEYPNDYPNLTWSTVQDRLIKLRKDNLIQLNILQNMKNPMYIWRKI